MAKLTRKCYRCTKIQELDAFPNHKGKPHGKAYICKPCVVEKNSSIYTKEEISIKNRKANLKKKYGITPERWDEIYEEQGGGYLICTNEEDLVVDHNHDTGELRGLLCRQCNSGLGMFKDNDLIVLAAARYLSSPN